ncbi:hypothetical protein [Paenirhodobacter populi]|uniref:Uncharacterized protein n=1 Tax=Paenirhodobacter populi TaxID=2306993 RepID=A0A443JLX8_9RHOB|nr:hypothetical protein [Sinirhodobacter populi]RWR15311.1 hypothetical protein D2T33_00010 [Sinirhodobacter populi]RWR21509.1 hypothetical protein D2T30_09270 [Sinirhodobacter populi]
MDFWVPVIFGLFKIGVLVTVIFLSIKSHRDGEKEEKRKKETSGQYAAAEHAVDASESELKVDR